MKVYLVRHGKTAGNLEKRYIGRQDIEVAPIGLEELQALVDAKFYSQTSERLFVSPMKRCQMTAGLVLPYLPIETEDGLKECDFGDCEGMTYEEIASDPALQPYVRDGALRNFPNGDDLDEFSVRCADTFVQLVDKAIVEGHKEIAMVAHGGVFMGMMSILATDGLEFWQYYVNNGKGYDIDIDEDIWATEKRIREYKKL